MFSVQYFLIRPVARKFGQFACVTLSGGLNFGVKWQTFVARRATKIAFILSSGMW